MNDGKQQVLPVYVLGDESASMSGDKITALNEGLIELRDEVSLMPLVREKIRLGVLAFSDTTRPALELSALTEDVTIPALTPRGGTSYAAAFEALYSRLPGDVQALKDQGFAVHRPAVFFLSDGFPTDGDWQSGDRGEAVWGPPLAKLHSQEFREHPNLLSFGLGEADPQVIRKVSSRPDEWAFMAQNGMSPGKAIKEFINALLQSVVNSATAMAEGSAFTEFEQPEGFVRIPNETL